MKLRGRELSLRMDPATGPDVDLLHEELSRLGPRYAELLRQDSATGVARFGEATARAVGLFQREHGLAASGIVDDPTASAINAAVDALEPVPPVPSLLDRPAPPQTPGGGRPQPADFQHLVRGQVRYEDGLPIAGLVVRAFDRRLRADDQIGKDARTDNDGLYEIFYSPEELRGDNRRYATLIVRAFDGQKETLIAESDIVPDAQVVEKINLRVAGGLAHTWSEYEQIMSEVTPLLEGADLASLTEDDHHDEMSYLSARLHRPPSQLAQLVGAHRLAAQTNVPPEVFYGLLRMQLPVALAELASQSPARLSRALRAAITNHIVPGVLADSVDTIITRLHSLVPEIVTGHVGVAAGPVAAVLGATGLPEGLQTQFVRQFVTHAGPVKDFWQTLRAQPEFANHVDDVGFAFQATAITGNHLPLVSELMRERTLGRLRSARDLARYTEEDWHALLARTNGNGAPQIPPTIKGANPEERARNYARKIAATVTRAYPAESLAYRASANERAPRDVRAFFKNVLDSGKSVDFARLPVDTLAQDHPDLLHGVADGSALGVELKKLQRIYRVAPRYESMSALLNAGFTSALSINQAGRQFFARTMSTKVGGSVEALRMWDRASLITASALNVMTNVGPWLNGVDMHVLPWNKPATIAGVSWESMFGTLDMCDCVDCQSVVSPAAYFAEVLAFLKERAQTMDLGNGVHQASNARDILFERRADLGNIELTCANTNTELPYIDLVNELLETAVAPFAPFALPAATVADLDARTLSAAITGAFTAANALLEPGAMVQVVKASQSWFVSDRRRLYVINKNGGQPQVTAVGLQTYGTADELAASPNHTNAAAYTTLAGAVFPWSLPLDLTIEETRQWIKAAGGDRASFMDAFRPLAAPFDPDEDAIAAERLGLTPEQRDLAVGATVHQPWELWGLAQNNNLVVVPKAADPSQDEEQHVGWIDALTHVRVFLARAACSYDELLQLLTTRFVNPSGAIRITSMDQNDAATCDTRKLVIGPLDTATLLRIQGFMRLWRAVGWTMRDLDLAIGVLRATEPDINKRLNLAFIAQLAMLKTLAAEHPAPIDELLTLWGPIDTAGVASLWARRFLDPSMSKPADPAFILKDDGSEVATAGLKISDHVPAILAGLGVEATDLTNLQVDVPSDDLTIANISALFRRVALARALGIEVQGLLRWTKIGGFNPFDATHPEDALTLARAVDACAKAGFTTSDVDFLLRHNPSPDFSISDYVAGIAPVLADIRAGLARIRDDVSMDDGASADLARKFLALLKWDPAHVELVVSALSTTPSFTAPLDGLSAGFAFPAAVAARVAYDDRRRLLTFAGVISAADLAALQTAAVPAAVQPEYAKATQSLVDQSDALVNAVKAYEFPEFRTALAAMPAGLKIPRRLKARTYYDRKAAQLCFRGFMLPQDYQELTQLSGADAAFKAAVDLLDQQAIAFAPAADNVFLTPADLGPMLAGNVAPLTRFEQLLAKLLPTLRRLLGTDLIREKLADALGADLLLIAALVDQAALDALMAPEFAESAPALPVEPDRFPAAFDAYLRIGKATIVATRLSMTPRMVGWYLRLLPTAPARPTPWQRPPVQAGWLDITQLPRAANAAADPARMLGLLRLLTLCGLRDRIRPAGDQALQEVFDASRDPVLAANPAALITKAAAILASRARWDEAGLKALLGAAGLNPTLPGDLRDETAIAKLEPAFAFARRLNASVDRCRAWAVADPPSSTPADIKNALRARTGGDGWVDFARPVQDAIRNRKRNALVDYLLVHPPQVTLAGGASQPAWSDVNGIYAYFLIDVQMDACMTTSRLKQAISSVQLFVQRALLNLEPFVRADATADDAWNDWKWMYSITLWHANKTIFLTPENWADVSTLDYKTPLFKQLETDLQQTSLNDASAEDAFLKYLEGLDTLARLDMAGMYQQDNADGMRSVLHAFGRTHGTPHVYYYRRQESTGRWSSWEKVDLDIEGEHLMPIVWNRRLYLFWPLFKVKAQETVPAKDAGGSSPTKYFDIQLAWSEYRRGRWTPKRVTSVSVKSGVQWRDPESNGGEDGRNDHVFFHEIGDDGLRIWPEWDNPSTTYSNLVEDNYGTISVPYLDPSAYVDTFFFSGCNNDAVIEGGRRIYGVFNPMGTGVRATTFEERNGYIIVYDPQGGAIVTGTTDDLYLPSDPTSTKEEVALKDTPGSVLFRVLYPHQDRFLTGRRPFFFEDGAHLFAVYPETITWNRIFWHDVEHVDPGRFDGVIASTYGTKALKSGPIGLLPAVAGGGMLVDGGIDGPMGAGAGAGVAMADAGHALAVKSMPLMTFPRGAFGTKNAPRLPMSALQRMRKADTMTAVAKFSSPGKLFQPSYSIPVFRRSIRYTFKTFDHPYACFFIHELKRGGVDTLMRLDVQESRQEYFASRYRPTSLVDPDFPVDEVDFTPAGAYSQYNWELFFYAPFLIATRLSTNQKFDQARRWFHYIFDPTDKSADDAPMKFWRFKPFHDLQRSDYYQQRIDQLLAPTASGSPNPQLVQQLDEWRRNPFSPHAIARLRLNAYQRTTVMRYLDNLINWADQLFRQDTIESINQATELYVLAANILGAAPRRMKPRAQPQIQTYNSLDPALDAFSDKLVEIETLVPPPSPDAVVPKGGTPPLPIPRVPYFCIPRNDALLQYWATVEDRLSKIRNCENYEGVKRKLRLWEPNINPGALVGAYAAGADLGSIMSDLNAPLPYYRFTTMAQKAAELVGEVRNLGAALLSALEKRDAEALAQLRSSQEITLLDAVARVKEAQVDEATNSLTALRNSRVMVNARYEYYKNIEKVTTTEQLSIDKGQSAREKETIAQVLEITASVLPLIGDFDIGASGWAASPVVKWRWGGMNLGIAAQSAARVMSLLASIDTYDSRVAEINARADRQWSEWKQQEALAKLELDQIDAQIAAASARETIAERERDNHTLQTENARAADEMLRTKFTNRDLYDWMITQLSAVYFQAYQLAYDRCKQAERCCRQELGLKDSSFIQFGSWDDLRQGLLAGERLMLDLKRMEASYLDQNRREFEITKHVSLALLNPTAVLALRTTGSCFFDLPEALFDLDHPGQYMRRIKSVGLTIPCVAGPYVSVNAKLTLLSNRIRRDPQTKTDYAWTGSDDPRFLSDTGGIQSIVTSSAREDNGLFELNFHDERYLPFEGAGAISTWRLELPSPLRQFDYDTIADVVLHVRYTARDGGDALRDVVSTRLLAALNAMQVEQGRNGLFRLMNLRTDFGDEWHRFFYGAIGEDPPTLTLALPAGRFAPLGDNATIKIQKLALLLKPARGVQYDPQDPVTCAVKPPGKPKSALEVQALPGDLAVAAPSALDFGAGLVAPDDAADAKWSFELGDVPATLRTVVNGPNGPVDMLDPSRVGEIGLLVKYVVA